MIRINLLSEGRKPVVARKAKASLDLGGQDPNNLLLLAGLIVALVILGGWWYRMNSELKAIQSQVREAQRLAEELRPIIEQVEKYKVQKVALEAKVQIIENLKRKQQGPVHIMDQISQALPDLLWLDDMQVSGTKVSLRGKAFNTNAVAAFIENLNAVPDFHEPDTRDIQSSGRDADLYSFRVEFIYEQALPEGEEAAAAEEETL